MSPSAPPLPSGDRHSRTALDQRARPSRRPGSRASSARVATAAARPPTTPVDRSRERVAHEQQEREDLVVGGHDHHPQHHHQQGLQRAPPGEVDLLEAPVAEGRDHEEREHVGAHGDGALDPPGQLHALQDDDRAHGERRPRRGWASPTKKRLSTVPVCTLKRARRSAPQIDEERRPEPGRARQCDQREASTG